MKTPQQSCPDLAAAIGLYTALYLKREDMHRYGSHKGRAIPHMMKTAYKDGYRHFVVSSSGNAALAAIYATQNMNRNRGDGDIDLEIFIGQRISEKKRARLVKAIAEDTHITLTQLDKPKQEAFQRAKEASTYFLRQSTDEEALIGYESLAEELAKLSNLAAIFIPTSSGTTALALNRYFNAKLPTVEIHIVQSSACAPMAEKLDPAPCAKTETSIAAAIVDKVAHRRNELIPALTEFGGGWVVSDEEITHAQKYIMTYTDIPAVSANSALSLAGLIKAVNHGKQWAGDVVCLLTGE